MFFKNKDLMLGYVILLIPFIIIGSIFNIHQFLLYTVYVPLFILCKIEDSGYISNYRESYQNDTIKFKNESSCLELKHINKINLQDPYVYKNYKVDYKLHGYPNVVREYTIGNNLYEIQRKYIADPKVSKLIRVIEIESA